MASHRKSTEMVKRRAQSQVDAELEENVLSPQEQRRQMLLNIGVWFLVLAFCMTSGVMCFSIGGQEKMMKAQEEAQQQDPVQADIDRWGHEVEQNPNDSVALANLGYYWGQKAQELAKKEAKAAKSDKKDEEKKEDKPSVTKDQALQNAHTYLDRSLQADPDYAFALQKYADLCVYEKNNAKARELLEKVVVSCEKPIPECDEKEALEANALNQKGQAIISMAKLDAEDKNYAEAERRLSDLIKEQPGNQKAFLTKASIIVSQENGDKNEALKCYGEALKIAQSLGQHDVALNCFIGRSAIYKEMGDTANAKKELEACKAAFAGNPMIVGSIDNMIKKMDGGDDAKSKDEAPKKAEDAPAAEAAPAEQPAEATPAQ